MRRLFPSFSGGAVSAASVSSGAAAVSGVAMGSAARARIRTGGTLAGALSAAVLSAVSAGATLSAESILWASSAASAVFVSLTGTLTVPDSTVLPLSYECASVFSVTLAVNFCSSSESSCTFSCSSGRVMR